MNKKIFILLSIFIILGGVAVYLTMLRLEVTPVIVENNVQLYYYNQKRDQEMFDYISCGPEAILPVSREIVLTQTPIQDTINLLLEGNLTPEEKEAGFSPMFPLEGVKLVGANLRNGTLTLEFDDPLSRTGGGSCRVGLLWNQIRKTAQQFSEVKDVRFLPEELFQP